jgi:hypothetical protein
VRNGPLDHLNVDLHNHLGCGPNCDGGAYSASAPHASRSTSSGRRGSRRPRRWSFLWRPRLGLTRQRHGLDGALDGVHEGRHVRHHLHGAGGQGRHCARGRARGVGQGAHGARSGGEGTRAPRTPAHRPSMGIATQQRAARERASSSQSPSPFTRSFHSFIRSFITVHSPARARGPHRSCPAAGCSRATAGRSARGARPRQ